MLETNAADECASIFLGFQQHIHIAVIQNDEIKLIKNMSY